MDLLNVVSEHLQSALLLSEKLFGMGKKTFRAFACQTGMDLGSTCFRALSSTKEPYNTQESAILVGVGF